MKKKFVLIGFILTLFLTGCISEVDTVSRQNVKEERLTVVITKAQDILLRRLEANLDGTDKKEDIQLIFDSQSHIVLQVDQTSMVIGNDIYHMVSSEDEDRQSTYDIQVIDKKIFVINEYKNFSSSYEDIQIKCYAYAEGEIEEVWNSNALIDLTVTEKKDAQQTLLISNKDFSHSLRLERHIYEKVVEDTNTDNFRISCSLGDSIDYRFLDYDEDGRVDLLVKNEVKLNNHVINPFYRVYQISETIELENCGFNDEINTEHYFN